MQIALLAPFNCILSGTTRFNDLQRKFQRLKLLSRLSGHILQAYYRGLVMYYETIEILYIQW